jgi:hypothetical protein
LKPECNDAILASVTHPSFKLKWVPKESKDRIKEMLLTEVMHFDKAEHESKTGKPKNEEKDHNEDNYFLFEDDDSSGDSTNTNSGRTTKNNRQLECLHFLGDCDTSINSLQNYPTLRKMFMKFNTALPSSAPVERLFSLVNMVLIPRRRKMTDINFEMQLMLKANAGF